MKKISVITLYHNKAKNAKNMESLSVKSISTVFELPIGLLQVGECFHRSNTVNSPKFTVLQLLDMGVVKCESDHKVIFVAVSDIVYYPSSAIGHQLIEFQFTGILGSKRIPVKDMTFAPISIG